MEPSVEEKIAQIKAAKAAAVKRSHDHSHSHGDHSHSHSHDGGHGHSHGEENDEEQIEIQALISYADEGGKGPISENVKEINARVFLRAFEHIQDITDLYEHNERFHDACLSLGFEIHAGRHAKHEYKHAYVRSTGPESWSVASILTNIDLGEVDVQVNWKNYDLFDLEDK